MEGLAFALNNSMAFLSLEHCRRDKDTDRIYEHVSQDTSQNVPRRYEYARHDRAGPEDWPKMSEAPAEMAQCKGYQRKTGG